ncbi:MAG: hypothetical protein A3F14_01980 [Gammaproteobacteria bacterium RIFCSPHIGHO2_12_FULL_43_28]|nr:MAG: hypothetical protein A3F14_01980 [Gammaproteobacteria bacterium RIFCSPHIGHO2_12_FULL_43_28]
MKKHLRSMVGVTLLEIMLVLAIAAMVIVMSVRYYQSATSSQQANGVLAQIQAITAAADSLAQASGSYATGGVATATVQNLVPQNSMTAPWGGAITVTNATASTYDVSVATTPAAVCPLITSRLGANNHFTTVACTGGGALSYTYAANP